MARLLHDTECFEDRRDACLVIAAEHRLSVRANDAVLFDHFDIVARRDRIHM